MFLFTLKKIKIYDAVKAAQYNHWLMLSAIQCDHTLMPN
jgi:hypothetical protein